NDQISGLYADRAGNLWIGNGSLRDAYLARFKDGKFTFFTKKDGLASNQVHSIAEDHQGHLWFSTPQGLTELTNGVFNNYPIGKGSGGTLSSAFWMFEDANRDMWIGSIGSGLSRLRAGHITSFQMKDGLFDDTIWSVLEDNKGDLWMSSNRGLSRVSKRDLNDFADHKRETIPSVMYGTKDGLLPDTEFT